MTQFGKRKAEVFSEVWIKKQIALHCEWATMAININEPVLADRFVGIAQKFEIMLDERFPK